MKRKKKIKRKVEKKPVVGKAKISPQRSKVIIILLILILLTSTILVFLLMSSARETKCGDNVCDPEEKITCPSDCTCVDKTYDEVIGEWGECINNEQRRITQNSCGNTNIETRKCFEVVSGKDISSYYIEVKDATVQINELNKRISSSLEAHEEGLITSDLLRSRLDKAATDSLLLYYDIKRIAVAQGETQINKLINQAIAAQLMGINEMLKYFDDLKREHLIIGKDWIAKSGDYANQIEESLS